MGAADIWALNILKIVVVVVAVHLTLTKIMPLVDNFLKAFLDKKSTDALTSLLGVLVIVLGGTMIVEYLLLIGNVVMEYIGVVGAGLELIMKFFEYLQYLIIVVIGVAVLKGTKKK